MTEELKGIPTSPLIWLHCKICKLTTRHVITNPEDCQEKAIYICCYKCGGDGVFTMCKEFYQLYYACEIDKTDNRLVYSK